MGTRLSKRLEVADLLEDGNIPKDNAAVNRADADERRRWTFRPGTSDWVWLFPREWWTNLDERRPISDTDKPSGRVGFLHRRDWHREEAVGDHILVMYVRNTPSSYDDFYDTFSDRFYDVGDEIAAAIDETCSVLPAEYEGRMQDSDHSCPPGISPR